MTRIPSRPGTEAHCAGRTRSPPDRRGRDVSLPRTSVADSSLRDVAPGITRWGDALRVRRGAATALALVVLGSCSGLAGCGSGGAGSVAGSLTGTRTEGVTAPSSSPASTSPVTLPARTETPPSQTVAGAPSSPTTVSTPQTTVTTTVPGPATTVTAPAQTVTAPPTTVTAPAQTVTVVQADTVTTTTTTPSSRAAPAAAGAAAGAAAATADSQSADSESVPGWVWGLIGACLGGGAVGLAWYVRGRRGGGRSSPG